MENISNHISYKEATESITATSKNIKNIPDTLTLINMKRVAEEVFEPLRVWYDKPIKINSFYRSKALNTALKGALKSQHVKGEAIDIDAGSIAENKKLYNWAVKNLKFDQIINEYNFSWIHISFKQTGNRQQSFSIK